MKRNFFKIFSTIFISFIIMLSAITSSCNSLILDCNSNSVGVWWWNDNLDYEQYLSFAKNNSVTDIYYCSSKFNNETALFISKAKKYGMDVYYLAGNHMWLEDATNLHEKINSYNNYQSQYPENLFKGIHLDIEPHQHDEFSQKREQLITNLIMLAHSLKSHYPNICFDYDLPFWLNDQVIFNNQSLPAYAHMINIANCVHLMSYRDTAEEIKNVSMDEIQYAKSINKPIFVSVEIKSSEGDHVSFIEEGKKEMYKQIRLLNNIESYVGVNIHHIESWFKLKN